MRIELQIVKIAIIYLIRTVSVSGRMCMTNGPTRRSILDKELRIYFESIMKCSFQKKYFLVL